MLRVFNDDDTDDDTNHLTALGIDDDVDYTFVENIFDVDEEVQCFKKTNVTSRKEKAIKDVNIANLVSFIECYDNNPKLTQYGKWFIGECRKKLNNEPCITIDRIVKECIEFMTDTQKLKGMCREDFDLLLKDSVLKPDIIKLLIAKIKSYPLV